VDDGLAAEGRHPELRAAWGAIYRGEEAVSKAKAAGKAAPEPEAWLREARALASRVPIDAKTAGDKQLNRDFKDKPEVKAKHETEWDAAAKANYARARELAERALGQVR